MALGNVESEMLVPLHTVDLEHFQPFNHTAWKNQFCAVEDSTVQGTSMLEGNRGDLPPVNSCDFPFISTNGVFTLSHLTVSIFLPFQSSVSHPV